MKRGFGFQWHITNECDQRCKHCYIYGKDARVVPTYLNIDSMLIILNNILDFCSKMNVYPYIYLTGGDPLLHPEIWKLLNMFNKRSIRFSILGNPFHIDVDMCKRLKQLGCEKYQMSIDGLERTHDRIRKKGSFQCTMKKFRVLKEQGIKTVMMSTVCKDNFDDIPELVRYAVKEEIDNFGFARYCPSGDDTIKMLGAYEYRDFLSNMWSVFVEVKDSNTILSLKDHLWIPFLDEIGVIKITADSGKQILDGCNCAISHMTILENGDVYACRRFNSKIGNALKDSFYSLYFNDSMDSYRDFSKFSGCKDCKYLYFCRGCPAVSACAYGDYYAVDPQCWVYEERKKYELCCK